MLQPGTKVRYDGRAYQWLKDAVGIVLPSSAWTTHGFVRVQFPEVLHPRSRHPRVVRLNERYLEVVEEVD